MAAKKRSKRFQKKGTNSNISRDRCLLQADNTEQKTKKVQKKQAKVQQEIGSINPSRFKKQKQKQRKAETS